LTSRKFLFNCLFQSDPEISNTSFKNTSSTALIKVEFIYEDFMKAGPYRRGTKALIGVFYLNPVSFEIRLYDFVWFFKN